MFIEVKDSNNCIELVKIDNIIYVKLNENEIELQRSDDEDDLTFEFDTKTEASKCYKKIKNALTSKNKIQENNADDETFLCSNCGSTEYLQNDGIPICKYCKQEV